MRLLNFIQMSKPLEEANWRPAVDIYRCPDGWLVKFDLAGVPPEEVEVSVRGHYLLISGTRRDWACQAHHRHYSMEIAYHRFQRAVELPASLDTAQVTIDYRYGMLLVHLLLEK